LLIGSTDNERQEKESAITAKNLGSVLLPISIPLVRRGKLLIIYISIASVSVKLLKQCFGFALTDAS
jgi:hypothetical protein